MALTSLAGTEVTSSHGITVKADRTLSEIRTEDLEMLVLPGGLDGVENIRMDLFATALIQKVYDKKDLFGLHLRRAHHFRAVWACWTAGQQCAAPAWSPGWAPPRRGSEPP